MTRLVLLLAFLALTACGGGTDSSPAANSLETTLAANDSWPYEVVGVLDIVEAGYGDSDDPEWAVGSIVTDDDEWGVSIEIQGAVISRAGIDIDSGKKVRAWLDAPHRNYGVDTYPVSRLEAL